MKIHSVGIISNLLLVLFLFMLSTANAQGKSENVKKNVRLENVTVQQLVNKLGDDFDYSFFIIDEPVGKTVVSVKKENATIREILDEAFKGKNIAYNIQSKNITISQEKSRETTTKNKIKGTVVDSKSVPIVGATLILQGSNNVYAISDARGSFSMEVPDKGRLMISCIGYIPITLTLNGQTDYKITMSENVEVMDEVVVVGYGTQRKGNLTGSISAVKSDKLTIAPIASVSNALAGQLPGLKSKQISGIPGADGASLNIRGFGTGALVIVDGVETDFNNIDPNQIESISILKDGAASIYGARAGNGVILVTLKRGSISKVTVALNTSLTYQNSTKLIKSGSSGQRAEWERESHINSNQPASQIPWTLTDIKKFYAGNDPKYLNTDWFNAAIRPWAPQQNHNVSVSGGTEKIKYYTYLGYNDQKTISRHDGGGYSRINLQSTVDATLFQGLVLSSSFNYINEKRDFTAMNLASSNYYYALYDSDPKYPLSLPDPTKLSYAGSSYGNALFVSSRELAGYSKSSNHNMRLNAALNYDVKWIKGLSLKAFFNYNGYLGHSKVFRKQPSFYSYKPETEAYAFERKAQDPTMISLGSYYNHDLTQQYSISYQRTFNDDHQLTVLGLHERILGETELFDTQRGKLSSTMIDQIVVGDPTTASNTGNAAEWARASFIGRINYGYKNRYLIETIFRADASSKFPKQGRWGYFPSVSVGWVASEENFLRDSDVLQYLKVRGSFGRAGNDGIADYQYYSVYGFDMSYILGDNIIQGLYPTGLANHILSWERISIYNAGVDFSLFNRKLYGTAEAFYHLRDGIPGVRQNSLPSTMGTKPALENLNKIDTRGFEFELGTSGKNGHFSYDVSANISWSRSKWVEYDEPDYTDPEQKRVFGLEGRWTDERWGYVSDGLFTSMDEIRDLKYTYVDLGGNDAIKPGDVKYLDLNNDDKLDWKDQVKIGKGTMPNWMYGVNLNFKYRNFDFGALFQGAFGYTTYIDLESAPTTLKFENRWTEKENSKNSLVPRPGSSNKANWWYSDYRNHNSSYIRLKSLSIGYELGMKSLNAIRMTKLRIYLAGTNLFTISSLSKYGVDPEAPEGTPAYYYPQQRTVSVGLSLTF